MTKEFKQFSRLHYYLAFMLLHRKVEVIMRKVYLVSYISCIKNIANTKLIKLPFKGILNGMEIIEVELVCDIDNSSLVIEAACICYVLIERTYQSRIIGRLISIKYL